MIEVAAGLVFHRGLLLITQRRPQDHLGGLWEFPGGKREPSETYEECLQRELREELGIEVQVQDLVASVQHAYHEKTVLLKFYRCVWLSGEPQALGCSACVWINPSQLAQYHFPPADKQLIQRLATEPELWGG
jgi:mutator protein MutT